MTRIRFGGFPLSAVSQPLRRDSPENEGTIGARKERGKQGWDDASVIPDHRAGLLRLPLKKEKTPCRNAHSASPASPSRR
jgi:hypothetical protein